MLIKRLKRSKKVKNIIVATTTQKEDDKVVKFCENNSINFIRGSKYDVLNRYYHASKKYNVKNYIRYKEDVKLAIASIPLKDYIDYTNEEYKIIFLPLVENIARKFSTAQEASGVMSIMDIIQEGSIQLCKAVEKIDREKHSYQ